VIFRYSSRVLTGDQGLGVYGSRALWVGFQLFFGSLVDACGVPEHTCTCFLSAHTIPQEGVAVEGVVGLSAVLLQPCLVFLTAV